jgi:hypothetical protein
VTVRRGRFVDGVRVKTRVDDGRRRPPKIAVVTTTIIVPARFNGPPTSGQGGYSCALLAARVEGPAAVSLRRPIPLDQALSVRHEDDGSARAYAGEELIAEAVPAAPLAPWTGPRVGLDEASAAAVRFRAPEGGEFDHCFVCGRTRHADGFELFTGRVEDDLVAAPWIPPAWSADDDGVVLPEFVWAALDCPSFFAFTGGEQVAFLARQQSELLAPIHAGETYVVASEVLERDGRKGRAAVAVLDSDGEVLAHAECLAITPRPPG